MKTRFGSKCVSLVLLAPFLALAACAPAPAKLLSPVDERYLEIKVTPPLPCSDLKIDVVNSYVGCERFGGMMDGDTFTKYDSPVDDSALMTAVDVRCYDLRPERLRHYAVCKPIVTMSESLGNIEIVHPEPPAPGAAITDNTSGIGEETASTFATKTSDGFSQATATAGHSSASASSTLNPNGTKSLNAGGLDVTQNRDGSFTVNSFGG